MTWLAIPLAAITALSTLCGGLIALRLQREITTVDDPRRVTALVGAGFLLFFLAERLLVLHHRDEAEQARAHAKVGALGAAGLSIHSFIDGLGIGLAFHLGTATGLLVFLAVVTHDFADGMNT